MEGNKNETFHGGPRPGLLKMPIKINCGDQLITGL